MISPRIELGTFCALSRCHNQLDHETIQMKVCGIVTKRYDLYFGSCGQIGVRWCSQCSYDVIICGGPLGDAPSIGVLCSVYKARCCRSSGLEKKQVSLRHKGTKATQQDLSNHILLYKTNGIDYVPHS